MARDTAQYGQFYWCIKLKDEKATEVFAMADYISVDNGCLQLFGKLQPDGGRNQNLIFAPGEWAFVYAASVMDGHAVAVDHWPGQIAE